jgi:YHS domain-containing protein
MLKGADVVAYFTEGRHRQGSAGFRSEYEGVVFHFATADHKARFDAAPTQYLPQYGGYCAFGVANGVKPDIDPQAFAVVGGKLYLNLSPDVQKRWQADIPGHIRKAGQNWLTLKNQ